MTTQIVTPKGQVSYPNVFTPKLNPNNNIMEYSIDILFPKNIDLTVIKDAVEAALLKEYKDKSRYPLNIKMPILDGDKKKNSPEEYAGKYYITARCDSTKSKPQVYDRNRKVLTQQSDIVGGDLCHLLVSFGAYDKAGNRGVKAYIQGVMLVEKTSEPFSGMKSAYQAFESFTEEVSLGDQNSEMFK